MVKRVFAIVATLFVIMVIPCFGEDECTKPTEYKPPLCPIRFPKIEKVIIEKNGAKSTLEKDPKVDCSSFKLTKKMVQQFFALAMKTDEHATNTILDWSPCYARGILTFADGKTGNWRITQFQAGSISIDNEERIYLYCSKCKFKPFIDTSDEGMEDSSDGSE